MPEDVVRRRHEKGLRNFFRLYRPIVDTWQFHDNSEPTIPRIIAAGEGAVTGTTADAETWNYLMEQYHA